jgi:4a-hydroxytetrahydrobiopterin dehydratase
MYFKNYCILNHMDFTQKHCIPCEGGMPPISDEEENIYKHEVPGWLLLREGNHKLRRQFTFNNFQDSMEFINKVAKIAEQEGHHPDIYIFYNKVQLDLFTHAVGGLSENDFIMASKIDALIQ